MIPAPLGGRLSLRPDCKVNRGWFATALRVIPWGRSAAMVGLCTLAACYAVPLPASRDATRYDTLSEEKPGAISAEQLKEKYGEPHLSCHADRLWVYGWSVGHGGVAWILGTSAGTDRLYLSYHATFLWFDQDGRLARVEPADSTYRFVAKSPPAAPICAGSGTCVNPMWTRGTWIWDWKGSYVCQSPSSPCAAWVLSGDSSASIAGKPVECR